MRLTSAGPGRCLGRNCSTRVRARLERAGVEAPSDLEAKVDGLLDSLIISGVAQFRLEPLLPTPTGPNLRVDESIRRMAKLAQAENNTYVVNEWHEMVSLSTDDRYALTLLDGTRDRDALTEELLSAARDNGQLTSESDLRAAVSEYVTRCRSA